MAPRIVRKYESIWSQWTDWCELYGFRPWLDRDQLRHSETLALFATYCWTSPPVGLGNAPQTVLSMISAISWRHRRDRGYPVGLHDGHKLPVQGMCRLSPPPIAKAPATIPALRAFRSRCNLSVAHDRVLWGAAIVGYFFMLRSAEYLHVDGAVSRTAIAYNDIVPRDAKGYPTREPSNTVGIDVRIRGSKTDQEGRSVVLSLERSGSGWLCPVLAVLDLLQHGSRLGLPPTAPLCSIENGQVVRASAMIAKLRQAASGCGIDPARMGTHSLRSGGTTAMLAAGVDQQVIKMFGCWASDSVDRYTRLTAATTRSLASKMAARDDRP